MFAILCRGRLRVSPKDCITVAQQFWAPQNAVLGKAFSFYHSSSSVCENDSVRSFTISYLINSCGLSSEGSISASKKVCLKSPEKPDAVLKLLREYGFIDAHILRTVTGWPNVLLACPNKILLPKLEFFRSIGVPLPVLAQKLSVYPSVLTRSLENSIIPVYNVLKSLLQSDNKVASVFARDPKAFGRCWSDGIYPNISMLRERGLTESSIVYLLTHKPSLLVTVTERLAASVDQVVEKGFDMSKSGFLHAIQVFVEMTESTLKHKIAVYKRCDWSESDITAAFLNYPNFLSISETKIMTNMDFLVNTMGCKPVDIAGNPRLLGLSFEKRIKPRCLVARLLRDRGLKNMTSVGSLLLIPEEKFLKMYIIKYEKDIPELPGIYRGKLNPFPKCVSVEINEVDATSQVQDIA